MVPHDPRYATAPHDHLQARGALSARTLQNTGRHNPGTKTRGREGEVLARAGFTQALEAFDSGAECVGTPGFTKREAVLLATISPDAQKLVKGA